MIGRYSRPEMAAIFSDTARLGRWLEIELLATEAWSALGVVPSPEMQIDAAEIELPPLKNFILPGGTEAAARLHRG